MVDVHHHGGETGRWWLVLFVTGGRCGKSFVAGVVHVFDVVCLSCHTPGVFVLPMLKIVCGRNVVIFYLLLYLLIN